MTRSFSPSHLVIAAVALLVGLALGGFGPRNDARDLRARLAEVEDRDCAESGDPMGRGIVNAFRGQPWDADPVSEGRGTPAADSPGEGEASQTEGASAAAEPVIVDEEAGGGQETDDRAARMDQVMDALELRRRQARQALIEQASPTDDQQEKIDAAVDDMNADLGVITEEFVATVSATEGRPDRRETMLFAREALDVLLNGEDAIWGSLDPDQRADVDSNVMDPFNYIDSSVVGALSELDRP